MGDFVLVQRSLFDHLRQHCENCHDFDGSLEDLLDGRVVLIPSTRGDSTSSTQKSSPVTGPPKAKKKRLRAAEAALRPFLQKAPKASEWRTRQIELDLKTVEQYESVIRAFGNVADIRREASYEDANSEDELVHLAERLALLTKRSLANAELQRSFALFQALILLSYCQVLNKRHVPFHEIDRVIGHIATNEKDRKKILSGASWINDIINKLVDNGWTIYRATELFFMNALSINNLKSIHYENNIPLLLDHLKSNDFVGHNYSDCLGPKYTIPGLVSCLLSTCDITTNQISCEEICNALGYPLDRVSQSIQNVYTVHPISVDGSVAAHSLRFEVLDLSSFGTSDPASSSPNGNREPPSKSANLQPQSRRTPGIIQSTLVQIPPNAGFTLTTASLPVRAQSHGQLILPILPQQTTSNAGDLEHTSGLRKRKSARKEASSEKRQRTDTRARRPSIPTAQLYHTDSHPLARDTGYSSPRSLSLASPRSSMGSQQSPALNHVNYQALEPPVDPILSYNIIHDTNQSDMGLREGHQQSEESEGFIPDSCQNAALISTTWKPAAPFASNQRLFPSNRDGVQALISHRSRVVRSPSPPKALFVPEDLLHNITVYFENSCRNMFLDDHGILLNSNGTELRNGLCDNFDSYCFTATMLAERNSYEEFGHALSKASALVEEILRAEHPRTLACFLEVFIHLIQTKLPDVAIYLCKFIKEMSAKVTMKWHPWGQICRLLGELDPDSLDQAMAHVWECTVDTFESSLGKFGGLVISVRLDYIKRVYGFQNYLEEERLLRDVLAQFNGIPRIPTPRVMLNLAHNLNKQGRHDEAEKMAQEVLSLFREHEMYTRRNSERIECKKIISRSQFNQGKAPGAEQTMREAIRMIVDQWGIQHPWVVEFMTVLEGWLRIWDREDDANTLRRQIGEMIRIGEA